MIKNRTLIKTVLFDLDQTLLDRTTSLAKFLDWQINFFNLVSSNNKDIFKQRFIELDRNGTVWKDIVYQQLINEFKLNQSVDVLLDSYITDFNKFSTAFDGVELAIKDLYTSGYTLGLISNGKTPFQENNFNALGLTKFFKCIWVSDAVNIRKPDPEIFKLACQQLNSKPEHCIFIGDNEIADIQGAKNVEMKTIFFNPDLNIESNLADANLHHFCDLTTIISKL
ncbi:HAD family hydrolase [Acinetobacter sp. ANC 3832]|uniref:HAD family hydrolase n=1 Tax=Acinetobacter sp. ANC 3832 TaxID=1977874 RepID=UPI000A34FD9E|nr:HAD family hydrolase [Acinetobacter sp. ANC 3832]OTG89870.1 haloacid dehalogenase [Acinetobacter sp. ANC 3832]